MRKGFWDRHGANRCKSLEENVWRKVVLTFKNTILEGVRRIFAAILPKRGNGHFPVGIFRQQVLLIKKLECKQVQVIEAQVCHRPFTLAPLR